MFTIENKKEFILEQVKTFVFHFAFWLISFGILWAFFRFTTLFAIFTIAFLISVCMTVDNIRKYHFYRIMHDWGDGKVAGLWDIVACPYAIYDVKQTDFYETRIAQEAIKNGHSFYMTITTMRDFLNTI